MSPAAPPRPPSGHSRPAARAAAKASPTKGTPSDGKKVTASIVPDGGVALPQGFADALVELQDAFGLPTWLLVHANARRPFGEMNGLVRQGFFNEREKLRACPDGALFVIDSNGGLAESAYQIAMMLRRHCGGFVAVVPRIAKSAGTLLTLGADKIYLGRDAELGPLDAQLFDYDREEFSSALDEVQALERLNSVALDFVDRAMFLLVERTGKKTEAILPAVLHFAAELMQPLLDKIDTVHYTQRSRVLKVAEDYASRLLRPRYSREDADRIARHLVNSYPEHGFVIDREELSTLLVKSLPEASPEQQAIIDRLEHILTNDSSITAIGRLEKR